MSGDYTASASATIEAVAVALYESERRAPKWNRLSDIGKNLRWDRARAALATPVVADAFRDAARLRSLAATFDNRLNRDQSFTGAQVAAMLRDGGE